MRALAATLLSCCPKSAIWRNLLTSVAPPSSPPPYWEEQRPTLPDVLLRYHAARKAAIRVHPAAIPPVFKACASATSPSTSLGVSIHADVIKTGLFDLRHTSASNSIMSFYIKSHMTDSALSLFDAIPLKDSVSWNAVIHGVLSQGDSEFGLSFFMEARASGFEPNVSTLVLVLQACWRLDALDEGLYMHSLVLRSGFLSDASVRNALLSMYAKSHDMHSAQQVFDEMGERDVISWSVLIGGYVLSGGATDALRLFYVMCTDSRVDLDGLAAVSVLQACGSKGDARQGCVIHGHLIHRGFEADLFVGNSLIDMYSKCLDIDSAFMAFDKMPVRNIVSWNSILSGLIQNEKYADALVLFDSMKEKGLEGDEVTLVNLLQSCKRLGRAVWCKAIHAIIIRRMFEPNESLLNSLLDAYSRCDLMELAVILFHQMNRRNLISWSTMIAGCAHCGKPDEAMVFFREMQLAQVKPSSVTMLSLLEAFVSSGELRPSKCAHAITIKNALAEDLAVCTALIDMYAKCGDVNASRKVFDEMPEKNILSWNVLIGALGMNGRAHEALAILSEMEAVNMKPNKVTMLSVLSACSHGGLVEEGLSCFQRMMQDPLLQPTSEHYSCVVDMLARAGDLDAAIDVIKMMAHEGLEVGPAAWGAVLSACRSHGNSKVGLKAAARVLELEPLNSGGYLLTSNLYAKGGLPNETARMRWLMKEKRVRVASGYSLVCIDQRAHKFVAWDGSHPQSKEIYTMVELLHGGMRRKVNNDLISCNS